MDGPIVIAVGDAICIFIQINDPNGGGAVDADALPTYRCYEDINATPVLTGTFVLFDATLTNGLYYAQLASTTFSRNKHYFVRIAATLTGVTEAKILAIDTTRRTDRECLIRYEGPAASGTVSGLTLPAGTYPNYIGSLAMYEDSNNGFGFAPISGQSGTGGNILAIEPNWALPTGTISAWVFASPVASRLTPTPVDVIAFGGDLVAAINVGKMTRAIVRGVASGTPTATTIPTSALIPAVVDANQYKGKVLTFDADTTTPALRSQSATVESNTTGGVIVLLAGAITRAPVSGDVFSLT